MSKTSKVLVREELSRLLHEREEWETNEYVASNKRLYALLADCQSLATKIGDSRKAQKDLNKTAVVMGVGFNAGVSVVTKVVRLVFGGVSRQRISVYSRAIEAANSHKVEPSGLANWLTRIGGVEEAKFKVDETKETEKDKRKRFMELGDDAAGDMEALTTLPMSEQTPSEAKFVLLVAEVKSDRSTEVLCFIDNEALVNQALVLVGKKAAEEAANDNEPTAQDVIDQAAASAEEENQPLVAANG